MIIEGETIDLEAIMRDIKETKLSYMNISRRHNVSPKRVARLAEEMGYTRNIGRPIRKNNEGI